MKAIILVGGQGKRLFPIFPDLPKPMVPIDNKPFLAHLLEYLAKQGIVSIIFSVHHMKEKIQDYFQFNYAGMKIDYVVEEDPLGTGGAMVKALKTVQTQEPVFVLNGDTFLKLDYQNMFEQHQSKGSRLTVALKAVSDCSRYGKVITDTYHITEFKEKGEMGPGYINAGVYLIDPTLFSTFALSPQFSFERDFLFSYLNLINPSVFIANDYFIDIGIPEDYARARSELVAVAKNMGG